METKDYVLGGVRAGTSGIVAGAILGGILGLLVCGMQKKK